MASSFRDQFSPIAQAGLGQAVVFDILGPDHVQSILPEGIKLVLNVNPSSFSINRTKLISRIHTKGGFVEQHWGENNPTLTFEASTGGFKRLYTGLTTITGNYFGGNRRETLAYDRYLDYLALFHNNGSIYDRAGQIVMQGQIQVTYDEGVYFGWFTNFSVSETADSPYQFRINAEFVVEREILRIRSA